jgi:hypothetical protein
MTTLDDTLQTDLFEDRKLLSLPSAAAIDAADAETLANVIEILALLERRLNRCRETSLLRSAIGHLRKFESERAAVAS